MKKLVLSLLLMSVNMAVVTASPVVKNIEARQRGVWNVDIAVTLEGTAEELANWSVGFVATNCATQAALPVTRIRREGSDAGADTTWTRRFVWDVAADVGDVKIDDMALTADVKSLSGVQLWKDGPYWAECNVGATKPEEYGYYFWWGDTVGYKRVGESWVAVDGSCKAFVFRDENCPTFEKDKSQLLRAGFIDETGKLVAAHDAATVHLGAPWRMPTSEEVQGLSDNCLSEWTTRDGVYGRLVKGKGIYASRSIFLPAAGDGGGSDLGNPGSYGYYWSSTPDSDYSDGAWSLYFGSGNFRRSDYYRYLGFSVRPLRGFAK